MLKPQTFSRNDKLKALLRETGWTQSSLAHAVNIVGVENGQTLHYDRTAVAHWLSGTRPQVPALIAEALARKLNRPVRLADIGFDPNTDVITVPWRSGDAVADLTDLVQTDANSHGHAALRRTIYRSQLRDLLSDWPTSTTATRQTAYRQPSQDRDLAIADHMLTVFAQVDLQFGGGCSRTALISYLAYEFVDKLIMSRTAAKRRGMLSLGADLAYLSGFRYFDSHMHGLAQRYYVVALALAAEAGDPVQCAVVLAGLSYQAHHLGHHESALELAEHALDVADGRLGPHAAAFVHLRVALGHAAASRASCAEHHQRVAANSVAEVPAAAPLIGSCGTGELSYQTARIMISIGDTGRGVHALRQAVDNYPEQCRRSRALALGLLTTLYLDTGRSDNARATWHQLSQERRGLFSERVNRVVTEIQSRSRLFETPDMREETLQ